MNIESQNQAYVELNRDEVARRAVRLWKNSGCPAGRDLEYWLEAEVELLMERQRRLPRFRSIEASSWPGSLR